MFSQAYVQFYHVLYKNIQRRSKKESFAVKGSPWGISSQRAIRTSEAVRVPSGCDFACACTRRGPWDAPHFGSAQGPEPVAAERQWIAWFPFSHTLHLSDPQRFAVS